MDANKERIGNALLAGAAIRDIEYTVIECYFIDMNLESPRAF